MIAFLVWREDSAWAASHAGGPHHRGWTTDRYLRKATFDAVQAQTHSLLKALGGKKARGRKEPKPWPGPDEAYKAAVKRRPKRTVADLRRSLSRFRKE